MDRGADELPAAAVPSPPDDYEWLRCLARISPVGIYRADAAGLCIYVNERWCELTGYPRDAALGSGWERVIHPEDRARVSEEWGRLTAQGRPFRSEYRYLQPGGRAVWVIGEVAEERDAGGRLTGYVGTATDITELRRMRAELERSQGELEERVRERTAQIERMALIVAGSDDAIVSSDFAGHVVSWNAAAEKIFGYTEAEMMGRSSLVLTPAGLADEARELKAQVRSGETVRQFETMRVAKSGELIEVAVSLFPLRDAAGKVTGSSAIVRDIRERMKAKRRLGLLSWRLLRMQDEERRRLARELHDSAAQTVAALALNLSLLTQSGAAMTEEKRAALLADSLELAGTTARELRTQSYLLHPPLLDERGLHAALRWFTDGFAERSGIAVELEIDAEFPRLDEQLEMTIFRVVQESLSNVRRHAQSPRAAVRVVRADGWVTLEIRDWGCGCARDVGDGMGVGIAGMRERLSQIGGSLTLAPNGPGTAVLARLPENL